MRPGRALFALAPLLFSVSIGSAAMAQAAHRPAGQNGGARPVTIDLNARSDDAPSHLCVVSFQAVKNATIRVENNLKDSPLSWSPQDPNRTVYRLDTANLNKLWNGNPWPMPEVADESSCTGSLAICRPEFALQKREKLGHFIQCVKNDASREMPDGLRVAVLLLDVRTLNLEVSEQPLIDNVTLNKNAVTLRMKYTESVDDRASRVIGRIVGGDYAESPAIVMQNDHMDLPLVRRCQEHEVALPPAAGSGDARVTLSLGDGGADRATVQPSAECRQNVSPNGHFRMLLPYLRRHSRRSVGVEVGKRERGTYARYEGSWFDFEPPDVLRLRHAAISFRWQRDCLYPLERSPRTGKLRFVCPEVSLLDAGIDHCTGTPSRAGGVDECAYLCDPRPAPGESAAEDDARPPEVSFDLPARVRFRRPGRDDVWVETVQFGNQLLSSFVPPDDRHIDVDLSRWGDLKSILRRRAAHIDKIVIRGPNGDNHYIEPDEDHIMTRIDLPGVRCGEAVAYQIQGERAHEEMSATVTDGRLTLAHPEKSEVLWKTSFFVGGGGILTWLYDPEDDAAHSTPVEPVFIVGMGFDWRPRGMPAAFSAQYAFLFGPQSYFGLGDEEGTSARVPGRAAYTRHLLEIAALWMPWNEWGFGGGLGLLMSLPLLDDDQVRVGDTGVAFVMTPGLIRYRFRDRWSVEAAGRVILGEEIHRFETDFRGVPRAFELPNLRPAFDLRLRYSL